MGDAEDTDGELSVSDERTSKPNPSLSLAVRVRGYEESNHGYKKLHVSDGNTRRICFVVMRRGC